MGVEILASDACLMFGDFVIGNHPPELLLTSLLAHRSMPRSVAGVCARAVGLTAVLWLAGCSSSAPLATFDLSSPSLEVKVRALKGVLSIAEPTASAPADSDRIVVRTSSSALAVVKGAQWTERLPRLLQMRLIQTFENAKLLKSISRPGDGATADYALAWDLRRFEMNATDNMARVEVSVRLLDTSGRIIAAQIFVADAMGDASEGSAAAQALDAASNHVLRQIVIWSSGRV